ncbi:hypothetical protein ACLB2K_052559 [Fragaria x ananassa]
MQNRRSWKSEFSFCFRNRNSRRRFFFLLVTLSCEDWKVAAPGEVYYPVSLSWGSTQLDESGVDARDKEMKRGGLSGGSWTVGVGGQYEIAEVSTRLWPFG